MNILTTQEDVAALQNANAVPRKTLTRICYVCYHNLYINQFPCVHRKEGVAQQVADLDGVSFIEEEYAVPYRRFPIMANPMTHYDF